MGLTQRSATLRSKNIYYGVTLLPELGVNQCICKTWMPMIVINKNGHLCSQRIQWCTHTERNCLLCKASTNVFSEQPGQPMGADKGHLLSRETSDMRGVEPLLLSLVPTLYQHGFNQRYPTRQRRQSDKCKFTF